MEGNFYNAATHNYYGFIVPYSPYAAVIPNTKLDLWTEETTGEPEDESDEEEPNAPSEPVIIAGTTFPSVMGALKYLSILTRDLLLYLKGTKNIVE